MSPQPQMDDSDKAAAALARRIEDEITAAGWPVGQRLGSEPELLARYGVSRGVLREAIRILEHHQVARTREGRGGGLIVTAPDSSAITRVIELYLQHRGATLSDLLQTKRALELAAVPVAIANLDEAGADRLRDAVARERTRTVPVVDITDDNVHIVLAELTGNPALAVFVKALTRLSALLVDPDQAAVNADEAYDVHAELADALIAGDGTRASAVLSDHLDDIDRRGAAAMKRRRR